MPYWFAAMAGIVLLTGLNIFAVAAMPDVFAGLMLLAVAMVLAYAPDLPRLEYAFWLAVIAIACLYHKAHLAILAVVMVAAAPFVWRSRATRAAAVGGCGAAGAGRTLCRRPCHAAGDRQAADRHALRAGAADRRRHGGTVSARCLPAAEIRHLRLSRKNADDGE